MKFFFSVALTALLGFASCLSFPWWSIAVMAFIVALSIPQKPLYSFLSAFIALFLLWGTISLIISLNNNHILASRVSLLIFPCSNPYWLIFATALTGGITAGMAALTGCYLRRLF